jgi:hypothetical protein
MHAQWWEDSQGQYTPSTITFDTHDGSEVPAISAPAGTSVSKPPNPAKAGLTFSGWFNTPTGGTEYDVWPYTLSGNATMHAQWTATVTFHPNGGSPVTAQSVTAGETATDPGAITMSGALFAEVETVDDPTTLALEGWYDNPEYNDSAWNFATPVSEDLNLYAKWTVDGTKSAVDLSGQSGANIIAQALNYIAVQVFGKYYTIVLADDSYTLPGISLDMEAFANPSAISGNITNPNAIITLAGKVPVDISLSPGTSGSLFVITGGELILSNNITLTGSDSNTGSLVTVVDINQNGGVCLTMDTGAKITGNTSTTIFGGGVSVLFGAAFYLNNGEISGNNAAFGGGVLVFDGGNFIMIDGEISGNTASGLSDFEDGAGVGGGVMAVFSDFTMNGGEISGNNANNEGHGGGVAVIGGGYNIEGLLLGGGSASFTMNGGTISGNTAVKRGGGVFVNNEDDDIEDSTTATFTMTNGTISGNTAERGGGVSIEHEALFSKTGNSIIYGDTDKTHTPGNNENTGTSDEHLYTGHVVWYHISSHNDYFCDDTLNSGNNISTSDQLPTNSGPANKLGNWIKEP